MPARSAPADQASRRVAAEIPGAQHVPVATVKEALHDVKVAGRNFAAGRLFTPPPRALQPQGTALVGPGASLCTARGEKRSIRRSPAFYLESGVGECARGMAGVEASLRYS